MDEFVAGSNFTETDEGEAEQYLGNAESKDSDDDDDFLPPEPQKKNPLQCQICSKILSCKQNLKTHVTTHEDAANRQSFRCEICEATFKSQKGLKYHLETKHIAGDERKTLPCPTCGRVFKSVEGRKIHMTIQHGASGPIFKCQECPMVFARKPHLDLHMTTHGIGLHVCTICGKPYARLKDLSKHEATCGVKELCCLICGKQFRHEQALENHEKKCRPNSCNFSCAICGQGFATEPAFGKHVRIKHNQALEDQVEEDRGRSKKSNTASEGTKIRMRRSKYDMYLGLEHLADPSTLIEEVKPVQVKIKPAKSTPTRIPCEHCSLKFVTQRALMNHNRRRHWEALGLQEPIPESRGRKRKRPLERVPKKLGRPRKIVNYVDSVEIPEETDIDAGKEDDGLKLEDTTTEQVANYFDPEGLPEETKISDVLISDKTELAEPTMDLIDNPAVGETFYIEEPSEPDAEFIKQEIIEFEDYRFGHVENGSSCSDEPVDELPFENVVADSEIPEEQTADEVDTLAVEPKLETNVPGEPNVSKELVIQLEKLDYFTLVQPQVEPKNKNPQLPRIECEYCGKTFAIQYRLAMHRIKEHGSTEKAVPIQSKVPKAPLNLHCDQCGKSYHLEIKLAMHKAKVHGIGEAPIKKNKNDDIRTCWHCKKELSTFHTLIHHLKVFHGETVEKSKVARCPTCLKKVITPGEMAEHVCHRQKRPRKPKYKNPLPRIKCEHCEKTFAIRYHLALHRIKEHGSTEIAVPNSHRTPTLPCNFHCDQCSKSYYLETNLAIHKERVHGIGKAPPKVRQVRDGDKRTCQHCKKQFTACRSLIYHLKFVHLDTDAEKQLVRCSKCRRKLMSAKELAEHVCLRDIPIEKERPFKCDLCEKAYPLLKDLEGHFSVHPEHQHFKCDQCSKGFFKERQLDKHKKDIHKSLESYIPCEICNGLFKTHDIWKQHQETHNEQALFCCEYCGKQFKMKNALRAHKYYSHAEHVSEAAVANQSIPCTICGQNVRGKSRFKLHMRKHNNDPLHKCSFPSCGKTFYEKRDLRNHEQTHTKDYTFKCNFCEYGTVSRKRIVLHEQQEHNYNRFAAENAA